MKTSRCFSLTVISLLLLTFVSAQYTSAQPCSVANIHLTTQSQVDNFQSTYGPCTEIGGDLKISGNVVNLDGLTGIEIINGSLKLESHQLSNIDGLSSLVAIFGELEILFSELTNIDSLASLTSCPSSISIVDNFDLENINGISGITGIVDKLEIVCNFSLASLQPLSGITGVNNTMYVSCLAIPDLDGLNGISFVGGDIYITNNDNLISLEGLNNILSIGGLMNIEDNSELKYISTFTELEHITFGIYINGNNELELINEFNKLLHLPYLYIDGGAPNLHLDGFNLLESAGEFDLNGLNNLGLFPKLLQIDYVNIYFCTFDELSSFPALEKINGSIYFSQNPGVTKITGFNSLGYIGIGLECIGNPNLTMCCGLKKLIDGIDDGIPGPDNDSTPDIGGFIDINNSLPNCSNMQQVLQDDSCPIFEPPAPIPAMSDWAKVLFALLFLNLAVVTYWQKSAVASSSSTHQF